MNKQPTTTTTTRTGLMAATIAAITTITIGVGATGYAQGDDTRSGPSGYTVLHHPSKPCHLSVEAVANWGETSAHLPQACTYDD